MTAERQPVTPDDLREAARTAHDALRLITPDGWQGVATPLEWTRARTITHLCGALQFYSTQLAMRAVERIPAGANSAEDASAGDLVSLARSWPEILAHVADAAPSGTRAFHPSGMADVEGFMGMGCVEVLAHCWDVVNDLGISFAPAEDLCDRVLRRLFPWSPLDTPRWQTLLWATGRCDLPGHERTDDTWMWQSAPLEEWDGTVKRSDRWKGR